MKILVTGDDGYKSIGTRLVLNSLKELGYEDITIAGTKEQQSGVGGKLTIKGKQTFGTEKVDGVEAFWIDGSPVDAIEAAHNYYDTEFDLVISGLNWGANIGNSLISSGTFAVAFRALVTKIAKRGIALNWHLSPKFWLKHYSDGDGLDEYLEYPGKTMTKVLSLILDNSLFGSNLLNVNLPENKGSKVKFVKPIENLLLHYSLKRVFDEEAGECYFPASEEGFIDRVKDDSVDTSAILDGWITVMPCVDTFLDKEIYEKLSNLV